MSDAGKETKALSSRVHPWGVPVAFICCGLPFVLAGLLFLMQGQDVGWAFFGVGLFGLFSFVLLPKPKYVELRREGLYLRGWFVTDIVPVRRVKGLTPFWAGKGTFWIEFTSETKLGKRVFVSPSLRELLRDFPATKRFDEFESVKELLRLIRQVPYVPE